MNAFRNPRNGASLTDSIDVTAHNTNNNSNSNDNDNSNNEHDTNNENDNAR